jgi:hypothetical protein
MKTFTTLKNLATTLSTNTSTANDTLFGQLINDQHRYLIQKYFDNERSATTQTIGSSTLTATGTISSGATSATLSSSWTYPSATEFCTFSNGQLLPVNFVNGSTAITWQTGLSSDCTATISFLGFQSYPIPANISKIKNNTISVGLQRFVPTEIKTRTDWDRVNYLPYNSDIPNYFFIYGNTLKIFPIPSTTGNILTFNYKTRVPDMTYADYTTGHLSTMSVGSIAVTGTGTSWNTSGGYPLNTDLTSFNLFLRADPSTGGDGIWYQIQSFQSDTALTLINPVINAPHITTSTTYTIGQIPLLQEDFQDMLVYGALVNYYSNIVENPQKKAANEREYEKRLVLLEEYAGTKTALSVDLGQAVQQVNPNLFPYSQ